MSTAKESEEIKTTVETTDYRSPAEKDREPTKEKVGVVHLTRNRGNSGTCWWRHSWGSRFYIKNYSIREERCLGWQEVTTYDYNLYVRETNI
ncbi:hypothetical protein Patl1_08892 [Pistacia atlantica]|uniref:Uncharacterized protein n=1 Tax=Pistacia atlantica TaxID=434234 RepID=A0ACC1AI57_9ROSI|nr:hypothetical protein Patl1_08892 [Pistacia atlantica]